MTLACTLLGSPKTEGRGESGAGFPVSQDPEAHFSQHAMGGGAETEELQRAHGPVHNLHLREQHGRFPARLEALPSPSPPPHTGV